MNSSLTQSKVQQIINSTVGPIKRTNIHKLNMQQLIDLSTKLNLPITHEKRCEVHELYDSEISFDSLCDIIEKKNPLNNKRVLISSNVSYGYYESDVNSDLKIIFYESVPLSKSSLASNIKELMRQHKIT